MRISFTVAVLLANISGAAESADADRHRVEPRTQTRIALVANAGFMPKALGQPRQNSFESDQGQSVAGLAAPAVNEGAES
jgi:hypothetical protein